MTSFKCLLVTSNYPPVIGGSSQVYWQLTRYLPNSMVVLTGSDDRDGASALGGSVEALCDQSVVIDRIDRLHPPKSRNTNILSTVVTFVLGDLPNRIRVSRRVSQLIRQHNIKVLCIGDLGPLGWLLSLKQRFKHLKTVIYVHGEEVANTSYNARYGQRRQRYLDQADAVVAVSTFTRDCLVNDFNLPARKIALIHNGVDSDHFQKRTDSTQLMSRLGLEGKRVLLGLGRLVPRKGFDQVIACMGRICAQIPNAHFLLVGDGPDRERLEKLIETENVRDHVTLGGALDETDVLRAYSAASLFIMPNRNLADGNTEGFGLVFLEAGACGTPVIGGNAGGVPDAIQDGVTGLIVDGTSDEQIIDAISRILGDAQLATKFSENGKKFAKEKNWESCARNFSNLCEQLVGQNGRSS